MENCAEYSMWGAMDSIAEGLSSKSDKLHFLPLVLSHELAAIDSEHECCQDDHKEHDRHAVSWGGHAPGGV